MQRRGAKRYHARSFAHPTSSHAHTLAPSTAAGAEGTAAVPVHGAAHRKASSHVGPACLSDLRAPSVVPCHGRAAPSKGLRGQQRRALCARGATYRPEALTLLRISHEKMFTPLPPRSTVVFVAYIIYTWRDVSWSFITRVCVPSHSMEDEMHGSLLFVIASVIASLSDSSSSLFCREDVRGWFLIETPSKR